MDSGLVCSVLLLIIISVITVVKYCGCSQVSPQQILTTVMMNIVVDKSTDHARPLLICSFTIILM